MNYYEFEIKIKNKKYKVLTVYSINKIKILYSKVKITKKIKNQLLELIEDKEEEK